MIGPFFASYDNIKLRFDGLMNSEQVYRCQHCHAVLEVGILGGFECLICRNPHCPAASVDLTELTEFGARLTNRDREFLRHFNIRPE